MILQRFVLFLYQPGYKFLFIMQVLYEYIFCCGRVHSNFGIFTSYPRRMLQLVGSDLLSDINGVLAVEEDVNFPDPLQYLQDEVWHMLLSHILLLLPLRLLPFSSFPSPPPPPFLPPPLPPPLHFPSITGL